MSKAQEEVHFSSMYAQLCLSLSNTPLEGLGETEKGKKFRKILLTRCQEEFMTDLATRLAEFESLPQVRRGERAKGREIEGKREGEVIGSGRRRRVG